MARNIFSSNIILYFNGLFYGHFFHRIIIISCKSRSETIRDVAKVYYLSPWGKTLFLLQFIQSRLQAFRDVACRCLVSNVGAVSSHQSTNWCLVRMCPKSQSANPLSKDTNHRRFRSTTDTLNNNVNAKKMGSHAIPFPSYLQCRMTSAWRYIVLRVACHGHRKREISSHIARRRKSHGIASWSCLEQHGKQ